MQAGQRTCINENDNFCEVYTMAKSLMMLVNPRRRAVNVRS